MAEQILVYGATGYTAGLIIGEALASGLRPVLAGRDRSKLEPLAARLGLDFRVADLADSESTLRACRGLRVVINAAGPFVDTVTPMLRACIETGAHYVDISGEVEAIGIAARHDALARQRGVMVLAGAGFDVVPSDCLCAHVMRRAGGAALLRVAISGLELASPGSAATLMGQLGKPTLVRRQGELRRISAGTLHRSFDFGAGPTQCAAVSWGDLVSAWYTTGVDDIETYFELTPWLAVALQSGRLFESLYRWPGAKEALSLGARQWTQPPSVAQRAARGARIVVEAEDRSGRVTSARLHTPEAYTLTSKLAVRIAARVLAGDHEPGFQTPARLLGAHFILGFDGVTLRDLQ